MPVRGLAVRLTRGLRQKDFMAEACACLCYVRDAIRYLKDIQDVETLHTCDTILRQGQGDCDDKCILLAALLLSIGHRVRFIAVCFTPGRFSHVWTQVNIRGVWVDLEPTEPIGCGKRIPHHPGAGYITREA